MAFLLGHTHTHTQANLKTLATFDRNFLKVNRFTNEEKEKRNEKDLKSGEKIHSVSYEVNDFPNISNLVWTLFTSLDVVY